MLSKGTYARISVQLLLLLPLCALSSSAAILYQDDFDTDTSGNYQEKWSYGNVDGSWDYDGTGKEIDFSYSKDSSYGGGIFVTQSGVLDNDFTDGEHYRVSATISFNDTSSFHAGLVFGADTVNNEAYGLIVNNHKLQVGRFNSAFTDTDASNRDEFKGYNGSWPGVNTLSFIVDVVKNGSTTVMNASVFDGSNTYEGSFTDNTVSFGGGQIGFWARTTGLDQTDVYSYDNLTLQTIQVPEPSVIGLMGIALLFLRKRVFYRP